MEPLAGAVRVVVLTGAAALLLALADMLTGGLVPGAVLVILAIGLGLAATMSPDPRLMLLVGAGAWFAVLVIARLVTRR
jgi:hypothetical protein